MILNKAQTVKSKLHRAKFGSLLFIALMTVVLGVPPAIGNATGHRLRSLPYTPDKLIEGYRHA